MLRRSIRLSLAFVLLLSANAWALGLGEIRLDSALNAPMRAQIELLSATPEELENLQVGLASQETFDRYGLDRPYYLQDLSFEVVTSGTSQGNYIRISSTRSITEPFLTFLVEATWSRGRLLREYTVLLDPPTFAPPQAAETRPAVTAPERSTPTDSAPIERRAEPQPMPAAEKPAARPEPIPAPAPQAAPAAQAEPEPRLEQEPDSEPRPQAGEADLPFETAVAGDDYVVQRAETLWGIASRLRPDSRLTMNQTMLAIFEANPQAFGGNINILRAGARLRIPSADDIYRIDRAFALNEAKRQNAAWQGAPAPEPAAEQPVAAETETRPSLQLVPPDEETAGGFTGAEVPEELETAAEEPGESPREQEILDRIAELEAADVPQQQSLIEIRDNELATLRQELAEIRGDVFEPLGYETATEDDEIAADDELFVEPEDAGLADTAVEEEAAVADTAAEEEADTAIVPPSNVISAPAQPEPTLLDKIIGFATNTWVLIIAGALILAGGLLFWFLRRDEDVGDEEWSSTGMSAPDLSDTALSSTEALHAPSRDDETFVVVEQGSGAQPLDEDTLDAPGPEQELGAQVAEPAAAGSMEDTFSSETAINLDQSDPIAEADFHMAYGLYDQSAELINGALETQPDNLELLTKLCEIYFVWGNQDAFVDAARRVKQVAGDSDGGEWDKIVIMGQQIAADDALFAGAGVAGATKVVDLAFEGETDDGGALDMDFGAAEESGGDVIDLGGDDDDIFEFTATDAPAADVVDLVGARDSAVPADEGDAGVDFILDEEPDEAVTAAAGDVEFDPDTAEAAEPLAVNDATSELPAIPDAVEEPAADAAASAQETAEINFDELGLDVDSNDENELAALDDLDEADDEITASQKILQDTSLNDELDIDEILSQPSGMRLAADETGQNPLLQQIGGDGGADFDETLLEATGRTQFLPEDFAVDTAADAESGEGFTIEDAETLLASLDDESEDGETVLSSTQSEEAEFDFAKTEALPPDFFGGNMDLGETGEMPAVASTDVDLDLDDLTAALKVSEMGDTVNLSRDDATVEQLRPDFDESGDMSMEPMLSLSENDMGDDLQEARTMTEVGTKLDLARAYVDMGDPGGARSILEEVLDEGDDSQRQQAQQLLGTLSA